MNRWDLTDELREKFKPLLTEYLDKVENLTAEQVEKMSNKELSLDLSDKGINPYQLQKLLEELGYEEDSFDRNGWQLDFWINMKRKDGRHFESYCENLVIAGCGITFELKLYIDDIDF